MTAGSGGLRTGWREEGAPQLSRRSLVIHLFWPLHVLAGRVCQVFDYGGSSTQQILEDRYPFGFPASQLKRLAFQLLQALKYMHSRRVRGAGIGELLVLGLSQSHELAESWADGRP